MFKPILYACFAGMALQAFDGQAQDQKKTFKPATLSGLKFRSIGPALTSGRIADIAVNPSNFAEYYVAVASGGIWKTTNAGVTYTPIFDKQGSYSIGCVSIAPSNHHIVWAGTGENNNQRSVAYGDGVYKSEDGGKSWKNMGLKNSEHIGMIKIHPDNPNVVYVAAYGPLWSAGGDRGLYKTVDGGKNWEKILEINEHTGINEVHFDPRDPQVIYATAHQRRRHTHTYISGGKGSALYKSIDGGKSFQKLKGGLPNGKMGRIGVVVSPANPDYVYAIIEAEGNSGGFYRSTDRGASWKKQNKYKTSGNYYQELIADPVDVNKVYCMDTYCHYTVDGGKTIKKLAEKNKHVDNHTLWINPTNTNHLLMGCDGGIYESFDMAKNWSFKPNLPVTQFYRVSVDNAKPFYNVYGGTQDNFSLGGPSRTNKESGIDNYDWFVTNNGDGFESQIDPEDPNIVYAQAQYGWLVRFDKKTGQKVPIQPQPGKGEPAYRWNWDAPLLISHHKPTRLYFAANKVFRSEDRGNTWEAISDDLSRQLDRNTFKVMGSVQSVDAVMKNRSTSIYGNIVSFHESPLNEKVLYVGTDDGLIQTSTDMGKTWNKVDGIKGVPAKTYVNDVKASMHDENVVYAAFNNHKEGDFKPYIYKSTDKGKTWESISNNLPVRGSVYSIAEDHVNSNLLFVGTEFGIFFTIDGGKEWTQLKAGLPTVAIRDIDIQRRENDLVLASFGRGFYILDDYTPLRTLTKETMDKEAHVFPIKPGLVFIENHKYGYAGGGFQGASFYSAKNPKLGATFTYYLKDGIKTLKQTRQKAEKADRKAGKDIVYPTKQALWDEEHEEKPFILFSIADASGKEISRFTTAAKKGINRIIWDGRITSNAYNNIKGAPITKARGANLALPGKYSVSIYKSVNGEISQLHDAVKFELRTLNQSTLPVDEEALYAFQREVDDFRRTSGGVNNYFNKLKKRISEVKTAVRNTTGSDLNQLKTLRDMEREMESLDIALHGNSVLSKHQFETEPGIMNRIGLTAWASWNNQNAPTSTQKADLKIAKEELEPVKTKLRSLAEQLKSIEKHLGDVGGPYLDLQLPKWE